MVLLSLVLLAVAVIVAGLLVGIEFAVAAIVNPIFDRLPGSNGLLGRADGARVLGRIMPVWYSAAVVLTAGCGAVLTGTAGSPLAFVAAGLFAASVVVSIVVLVPINNRVATWSDSAAPSDWRDQVERWGRWHILRLVLIGSGLALIVAALAID